MNYVGYFCTEKTFKCLNSYEVESFDVFRNFRLLHGYYKKIVSNYTQSVEDLEKDFLKDITDNGTWCEHIILKNNEIAARAVIWKLSDNSYEIAALSLCA
jgi:hypothetical protein